MLAVWFPPISRDRGSSTVEHDGEPDARLSSVAPRGAAEVLAASRKGDERSRRARDNTTLQRLFTMKELPQQKLGRIISRSFSQNVITIYAQQHLLWNVRLELSFS